MKDQKAKVIIYTKDPCPYCFQSKAFFKEEGIVFEEVKLANNFDEISKLQNEYGYKTLPMILVGGKFIGGYTDMKALHRSGKLEEFLKG